MKYKQSKDFKVYDVPVNELNPAEYNPRKISSKEMYDLKNSIEKFRIVEPLVVNKHKDRINVVVGGHQRLKLWTELGYDTIPCKFVDLDLELEKELNVRLNKNGGQFDDELLAEFFTHNQLIDYGFDLWDLKEQMDELQDNVKEEVEIEKMETFLYEHHDYIVVKFDHFQDFLKAVNIFDLRRVDVSISEKTRKTGLGRIMKSETFFKKLKDYVAEGSH